MKWQLALFIAVLAASPCEAHFVYILPASDHKEVRVVFSDSLRPDGKVPIDRIAATELVVVDASGKQTTLKWEKADHFLRAALAVPQTVLVGGATEYGWSQSVHTHNVPVLLKYYPKAIVGNPAAAEHLRLGVKAPFEILPLVRDGILQFQAVREDKPVPDADCAVIIPGREKAQRLKTDADGLVPIRFDEPGRYGVRVKVVEATPGEWKGRKYDEIHLYATLVVDFGPRKGR
jgi:hypothetical protein